MRKDELVAVVTINREAVGGDVPIFFAATPEEQVAKAAAIAVVLKAMVHDVGDGVLVVVQH